MEISGEWEAGMIYFNVKELWKEQWAGANLQTKALRYLLSPSAVDIHAQQDFSTYQ